MARHEFGIMQSAPRQGRRYEEYEPWNYDCISVEDEDLAGIAGKLASIDFCWHTTDVRGKGLAYCGITLIPPDSDAAVLAAIGQRTNLSELTALFHKALAEHKWIIHYGL